MSDNRYWNKTIETMPRKKLRELQLKKLKETVKHCYENSQFYQRKFKSQGLTPDSVRTLEDLQKIPFTVKNDLRDNYPMGLVAVDSGNIVEIHASSGTTGNPVIGAYTRTDIEAWQELMARSIYTFPTAMAYSRAV
jgi:phenylacetate-CoA ligase